MFLSLSIVAKSQTFVGVWKTFDDKTHLAKSHVKIYKAVNGKYYGKVSKILNPEKKDATCTKCKGAKKNKPILDLLIIENMKFEGNELKGGTILDPENGSTYDCKIWLENGKLIVRGYWGWFFRTQTWTKVQ